MYNFLPFIENNLKKIYVKYVWKEIYMCVSLQLFISVIVVLQFFNWFYKKSVLLIYLLFGTIIMNDYNYN